jgi:hypothetical protein
MLTTIELNSRTGWFEPYTAGHAAVCNFSLILDTVPASPALSVELPPTISRLVDIKKIVDGLVK